ncbi:MAG TPA: HAMP domain-containing sensor histidine kinase [Acidimicrobiia bacterium]|nr:HAMP domain-containing sensor histidine kinase [Acidimicrobiia bacterium]
MTLRLRLVLGLVALVTLGLAIFGVVTYQLYARSQYDRLDAQAGALLPLVSEQLVESAGLEPTVRPAGLDPRARGDDHGPAERGPGGRRGPTSVVVPPGTYAELRDGRGNVLAGIQLSRASDGPDLPDDLDVGSEERAFSTGSGSGSDRWRVHVAPVDGLAGGAVVVAVPMTEVRESLNRLVAIEGAAAAVLLTILAAGSWLILRRGLRPLEQMATSARTISAGDLSERVSPSDGTTEVGQLGLALNTMLDEIEEAFSEREETEQRLRQFLADASHELRTPLTSIQGFAELFRLGPDQDHVDLPVILRRIEQESGRMKRLVEDLLLLARLDETRPAQRVPVDLAVLAADACSDAVAAAPDRPVTLDAPEPVVVQGDRDHLRQAIANLVANALRHTPAGTPLEVVARLERDGDAGARRAVVSVRDHGPGLGEEALAHAFDRFWRADAARVGHGAGLGLAIVAGIAEEHGGEAEAANAPGGGAVFTLRLPV